jgi:hypothetical protein
MARNDQKKLLIRSITLNVIMALIVLLLVFALIYEMSTKPIYQVSNTTTSISATTRISTSNQTQNGTLAGINDPLNSSSLAIINNEPLNYYQIAGEKLLNGSLINEVLVSNSPQYKPIMINGKPTVVYIGATTCPFCGENRWAMALALAKFGNFSALYQGYSALQDGDVPTLYWVMSNTTTPAGVDFGNYYSSNAINFISAEYESPITGHFEIQPLSFFIARAPNATYRSAIMFMNRTGLFQGTPFTFWGTSLVNGADAVVLGNNASTLSWQSIASMTHAQILSQISHFNDQFAWGQYAAADLYIADLCPSVNNTAPVCALPAIKEIGSELGLLS